MKRNLKTHFIHSVILNEVKNRACELTEGNLKIMRYFAEFMLRLRPELSRTLDERLNLVYRKVNMTKIIRWRQRAILISLTTIIFMACNRSTNMINSNFKSEKVSQTASFIVNSNIEKAFPMFDAFEERKWAEGLEPNLVYPDKEIIEEGTTFKTEGHDHEAEYLWIVTKFDPKIHFIQYLVSTENRFWTIAVKCKNIEDDEKTEVTVTYSYIGLNEEGNELNKSHLERMYKDNLNDWAEAINNYFAQN